MHVVGHQYVSMNGAAKLGSEFFKVMQVELVILFGMETRRTIIAALDDVPWDAGYRDAGASRHGVLSMMSCRYGIKKPWSVPHGTRLSQNTPKNRGLNTSEW